MAGRRMSSFGPFFFAWSIFFHILNSKRGRSMVRDLEIDDSFLLGGVTYFITGIIENTFGDWVIHFKKSPGVGKSYMMILPTGLPFETLPKGSLVDASTVSQE